MYSVICDNCGKELNCDGIVAWTDQLSAKEMAMDNGFIKHFEKDICENCWQYDENDNIILKNFNQ